MPKIDEAPKPVKVPKSQNECGCGCGGLTFNRFLPGHDAKLKSRLLTEAASDDGDVASAAQAELESLGWLKFHEARSAKTERRAMAKAGRDQAAAERAAERAKVKEAKKEAAAAAKAAAAEAKAAEPADAEVTPAPAAAEGAPTAKRRLNRAERQAGVRA
jgi:colicin import membrane protein